MRSIKKHKILAATILAFSLLLGMGGSVIEGHAASGTVYSCTVNRGYRHPVTGAIEDAGGEGSYVTGQGMIEGCIYPSGLFEQTDTGECYLTIRMGLADFTSGHAFYVQSRGESGWTQVSVFASSSGSDANGTTLDVCIPVPQADCVVRGSMYVDPMGRDVIFFLNPSGFVEGNSVGMVQSYVTEASAEPVEEPVVEEPVEEEVVEEPEAEEAMPNVDDSTLDNAKGLSLSTEKDVKVSEKEEEKPKSGNSAMIIVIAVIAIAAVAGGGVWVAKKNKNKGDTRDDEE